MIKTSSTSSITDDAEIIDCLERLRSSDLETRCCTLLALKQHPEADQSVANEVATMLEDRSACLLQIPIKFGELRWLAAHALAAIRQALGQKELVTLFGVADPLAAR